jgi:predicted helicase
MHVLDRLRSVKTFKQLVTYLKDELDWPIDTDDFDELTFEYSPEELGLDNATAAKIKEVKQLRPLAPMQPWGIFFVNFEPKRLPVVALRRILSTLVLKKRQSANKAQQAAWRLHDLLFISSYGESDHRDITFAHFAEEKDTSDLPTLRVLGWDDEDTELHIDHVERELKEKLRWPEDDRNLEAWRKSWSAAFTLRHREVITTSKALAERIAELARGIRKRANLVMRVETDKGPLRKLYAAFKEALIHDLSEDDFADMYAQTISYGLLTARVSRPAGLVADNLSEMVPITNPFLKELLETFLTVGGRKGKIDFDELGANEVVQLLRDADMEAVLRDFGDRNPQEDPVIHFYELFLKEYDARKRIERGVFYTPRPVVSYIVRSVHEILQKEFGLEDGLADTTTWDEFVTKNKKVSSPAGVDLKSAFVQILDPATGTGTFLVEAIDVIHKTMEAKWKKQGFMALEFERLWNEYVPKHLLPRLHGFELMMAPYAIAHMKIGLKLAGTGYRFRSDERARVYLTNSLEPPTDDKKQREFEEWAPALAHEAATVNAVKGDARFTVVIGNPPYAGISSNMSEEAQSLIDVYRTVDSQPLNEKKLWLQDDYVKFIRYAQLNIDRSTCGVWGYITNHGYLDNPTFRGMRQSLMSTFDSLRLLDLHGNANKKERAPDGSEDVNVFEIRQGVAICLGSRTTTAQTVKYGDLWGSRQKKYEWLLSHVAMDSCLKAITPQSPFYFFKMLDGRLRDEYESFPQITEIMPCFGLGFQTSRDDLVIGFTRSELETRIERFIDRTLSDSDIRKEFFPGKKVADYAAGDTRQWSLVEARRYLRKNQEWRKSIHRCLYRPFEWRLILYDKHMVDWPRPEVMGHMLIKNLCLLVNRQSKEEFAVLCANTLTERKIAAVYDASSSFPLYLTGPVSSEQSALRIEIGPKLNLAPKFVKDLTRRFTTQQSPSDGISEETIALGIFEYIYAVFHSMSYRLRYSEYLRVDFPRVPVARHHDLFGALAAFGRELVKVHLLESAGLNTPIATFTGTPNSEVDKISYSAKTVWLNKEQTRGFRGVSESVWNFHIGGYQVCEKWLKDRKGRKLSKADIEHYQKIIVAISETIRIMAEIDKVIDAHGGWPGAFATNTAARHGSGV